VCYLVDTAATFCLCNGKRIKHDVAFRRSKLAKRLMSPRMWYTEFTKMSFTLKMSQGFTAHAYTEFRSRAYEKLNQCLFCVNFYETQNQKYWTKSRAGLLYRIILIGQYIWKLGYKFICALKGSRDSSVGIATRYGPDGAGIESRLRRDYPHLSRPRLWPNLPPIVGSFPGVKRPRRGVGHPPHLVPRLKK